MLSVVLLFTLVKFPQGGLDIAFRIGGGWIENQLDVAGVE